MKQRQTKKQSFLELIEKCLKKMKEVNDLKKLSQDKVFKVDISLADKLAMKASIVEPKIKPIRFSDIRTRTKRRDSFAILMIIFCLLAVFLGFFGKYLSRPGFYNFQEQDKYAQMLYYILAVVTAFIGVILYFKYRRTVIKKKSPVSLLSYRYNLRILKETVNKMTDNEVDKIFNSI